MCANASRELVAPKEPGFQVNKLLFLQGVAIEQRFKPDQFLYTFRGRARPLHWRRARGIVKKVRAWLPKPASSECLITMLDLLLFKNVSED